MTRALRALPAVTRIGLGLVFFVFGLNGFLNFLPPQPPPPPAAGSFFGALAATGYLLPLLKGTEVAAGLLLLSGRWVPLALALLAPIIVNIVLFHLFLSPSGMALALFVLAAEIALAWWYRAAYRPMLQARTTPEVGAIEKPANARAAVSEA